MKELPTLPRLEIGENTSPFDEAVIVIDGREEETIRVECPGAAELAEQLVLLVNNRDLIVKTLLAAAHALRSYQFGNSAPDLAQSIADNCETVRGQLGAAA